MNALPDPAAPRRLRPEDRSGPGRSRGGLNDPRVQYREPTKWTARLRDHWQTDRELLLRTNMGAGHGGSSGRYGWLEDRAFRYAFVLDPLGPVETPTSDEEPTE